MFHIVRSYAWWMSVFVLVMGMAIVRVGIAEANNHNVPEGPFANVDSKLDALQASVDALFPSLTVFPGDGVNGPGLAYRDNGDGTITDMNTGLMWEMKVGGGAGSATCLTQLHALNSLCTWFQASGAWIDDVNFELYAGYDDWRLPNIRELMSILDYGTSVPAIDPIFGPPTAATIRYWSLTSSAPFPARAWDGNFRNGVVGTGDKAGDLFRVRAVRGGR